MGFITKRATYTCPSQSCDYWYDEILNPENMTKPIRKATA